MAGLTAEGDAGRRPGAVGGADAARRAQQFEAGLALVVGRRAGPNQRRRQVHRGVRRRARITATQHCRNNNNNNNNNNIIIIIIFINNDINDISDTPRKTDQTSTKTQNSKAVMTQSGLLSSY